MEIRRIRCLLSILLFSSSCVPSQSAGEKVVYYKRRVFADARVAVKGQGRIGGRSVPRGQLGGVTSAHIVEGDV